MRATQSPPSSPVVGRQSSVIGRQVVEGGQTTTVTTETTTPSAQPDDQLRLFDLAAALR